MWAEEFVDWVVSLGFWGGLAFGILAVVIGIGVGFAAIVVVGSWIGVA